MSNFAPWKTLVFFLKHDALENVLFPSKYDEIILDFLEKVTPVIYLRCFKDPVFCCCGFWTPEVLKTLHS